MKINLGSKGQVVAYLVIALVTLFHLVTFPNWTVDDAYIGFRYAQNLVSQGEFVYNLGEDPVEGYTGVLLTLLVAAGMYFGIAPELTTDILGVLSFLGTILIFHRLLRRFDVLPVLQFLLLLLLTTAAFLYTHVYSGLETMMFTMLLLWAALQSLDCLGSDDLSIRKHACLSVSLLLLCLSRPEGTLFTFIILCLLIGVSRFRLAYLPAGAVYFLTLILPGLIYVFWRLNYYGFLLPNTYFVKVDYLFNPYLTDNAFLNFRKDYVILPALALGVVWISSIDETVDFLRKAGKKRLSRGAILTLISLFLFSVIVLLLYQRSHLYMNYSYRFYAPFYPIALLLIGWLLTLPIEAINENAKKRAFTQGFIYFILSLMFTFQIASHLKMHYRNEIPEAKRYRNLLSETHEQAGYFLKEKVPPDEWLIVHADAGAIPYYSRLKTVDFGMVTDEYLAHNKTISMAERVDYFFSINAGAVAFTSYNWDDVDHGAEANAITADPRFSRYTLKKKYRSSSPGYYQFVFLRKDLEKKN